MPVNTQAIGKKESEMTIGEIDKLLAPRFPMVGIDAPAELKMSVDDWVGVVNYAIIYLVDITEVPDFNTMYGDN